MLFSKSKIVIIDNIEEMNKHLKICKKARILTSEEALKIASKERTNGKYYYNFDVGLTTLTLRYTPLFEKYTIFLFALDGRKIENHITGMEAFALLQKMSNKAVIDLTSNDKLYDLKLGNWKVGSIAGLLYYNQKFFGKRYDNCFSYDLNSSYAFAMLQPMPDTSKLRYNDYVKDNEIGFLIDTDFNNDTMFFATREKGRFCQYVCPIIESPFKRFVNYYYNKKVLATTKEERTKYKDILNFAVGYIRRKNPFIHSAILSFARNYISKFIDKNTIYCNTDSIVSFGKRKDIEKLIGNEIGQFKLEKQGCFAYNGSGYQWNYNIPSIRGKSKEWFQENGFDILNDTLPYVEKNKYYLDYIDFQLKGGK